MQGKILGKIKNIWIGDGGYDSAQFGVTFELSFEGGTSGCMSFWGTWTDYSEHAKYSKKSWEEEHSKTYEKLRAIMKQAKVKRFHDLIGKPIEAEFGGINDLVSWRILTEVL